MAFTRGLFYPWIDIENEGWLKTAALYWDTIQTIVPEGMPQPYKATATQAFYSEGLLEPFVVSPQLRDVRALTESVQTYLQTPEGIEVLAGGHGDYRYLHPDKLPREVQELVRIHPAKLPDYVRSRLRDGLSGSEWIAVDRRFAAFYMTLLATRLSGEYGLGLLTDTSAMDSLATSARLDAHQSVSRAAWHRMRHAGRYENPNVPSALAQGVLANLVLERLELNPKTPVKRIIKFREAHAAELGRFRSAIGELAASVSDEQPIQALQQHVADLYSNQVKPALTDLGRALTGSKIKFVSEHSLKVSYFSLPATALPLLLGAGAPYALLAGAGVSLTAAVALYSVEKMTQLRENPYAYVMAAEREFR